MIDRRTQPHFAAHCEMQDAAENAALSDALIAPGAISIELAKILTRFDAEIDDEWRAQLIKYGGELLKLHGEIERDHG